MTSIDILVPVYNRARYLPELLDSCVNQSRPADKIILVDDASSESEVQHILTEYSKQFPNILVITHQTNRGICSAQETGLRSSSADFIAFLDCDDFLPVDALKMVEGQLCDAVDYLFTDRIEFDEVSADGDTHVIRYGGQPNLIGHGEIRDHLLDHMVASHLKVIRRTKLLEVGGFSNSIDGVQDWDIALKISESGTLRYLPEPLYFHRIHTSQASRTDSDGMVRDTNIVRRSAFYRRNPALKSRSRRFLNLDDRHQLSRILNLAETSAEFNSALGVTQEGSVFFVPMFTNKKASGLFEESISFLLIHHKVVYQSDDLKPFLLSDHPPSVCFVSSLAISRDSSYRFRWLNSYFDYVIALDALGELAIQGFLHHDLEIVRPATNA